MNEAPESTFHSQPTSSPPKGETAVLLTGATGFLGGRLLRRLLRDKHPVIVIARGKDSRKDSGGQQESAEQRISKRLTELGCRELDSRIKVIEADLAALSAPELGREVVAAANDLGCRRLLLVTVAASLRMDYPGQPEKRRALTIDLNHRTNVQATETLLGVLDKIGNEIATHGIVHISTCYAHGKRRGVLPETMLETGAGFNNSYEETKQAGEAVLKHWHRSHPHIPITVIRPSIVTGEDTDDGYVAWLDALLEPAEDGRRAADRALSSLRRFYVPFLPLLGNGHGILDLVDAEDVERYSYDALRDQLSGCERAETGVTYLQLANPSAPTLNQIAHLTLHGLGYGDQVTKVKFFDGMRLFQFLLRLFGKLPVAGAAMRGVLKRTEMLRPYLLRPTGTRFETHRTIAYFKDRGIDYQPRLIDLDYVAALIASRSKRIAERGPAARASMPAPQLVPDERAPAVGTAPDFSLPGRG